MAKTMKFDEGYKQLEALVESLEKGDMPLEEAFSAYKQGVKLLGALTAQLDAGEKMIRELTEGGEGLLLAKEDASC